MKYFSNFLLYRILNDFFNIFLDIICLLGFGHYLFFLVQKIKENNFYAGGTFKLCMYVYNNL